MIGHNYLKGQQNYNTMVLSEFMKKNILIIGSGGREHAIALALSKSENLGSLYIAPGNPGTATLGRNVDISETDLRGLLHFAKENQVDLTIVGPEGPLVEGIVDLFENEGLGIVGPSKAAAQLEGSKKWAKALMKKYDIPTAYFETFSNYEDALAYIAKRNTYPIVIKADGLAAGKGVTVAATFEDAKAALAQCLLDNHFKDAGLNVVIEDFLIGQEASVLAFCDGETVLAMIPAQDHKQIFDGDKGPNTGGMGTYAPAPIADASVQKKIVDRILNPLVKGLSAEGVPFKGVVFAGVMIHDGEPSVVEFNARFGDPETQVVLALLKTDLVKIFQAIVDKTLSSVRLEWEDKAAVCVVLASEGYPGDYPKGRVITLPVTSPSDVAFIHAGTKINEKGELVTNGGRVMGVVGIGEGLMPAIQKTYEGVTMITFEGRYYRSDIAKKALVH